MIQYRKGNAIGKNPGTPLLIVAKKINTPEKTKEPNLFLLDSTALKMIITAVKVNIPIVFSIILLEYDQEQEGIVIQNSIGSQLIFLIASSFLKIVRHSTFIKKAEIHIVKNV
jgi:hypothetical protein